MVKKNYALGPDRGAEAFRNALNLKKILRALGFTWTPKVGKKAISLHTFGVQGLGGLRGL